MKTEGDNVIFTQKEVETIQWSMHHLTVAIRAHNDRMTSNEKALVGKALREYSKIIKGPPLNKHNVL